MACKNLAFINTLPEKLTQLMRLSYRMETEPVIKEILTQVYPERNNFRISS